jgi:phosphoglycerate dehydrogenase-like enzyme
MGSRKALDASVRRASCADECQCGSLALMPLAHVLEYQRDPDGVWNLPAEMLASLGREFPRVEFLSPASKAEADEWLPKADVVMGWAVRRDNLARAERLRWIHVTAAGVHGALFPELVASPITLTNGRGIHAVSMAEHTLGVLLAFARKLHLARDAQRERKWIQERMWVEPPPFGEVSGSTLGLVGLGAIGSAIASRARALGMRVVAVRRHPAANPEPADTQWGAERLDEMLALADWVVLATPLTPETRGLIDARRLALMKRSAVLVNIGRGALVDEAALIAALERGGIAGAALDVAEKEPLPASSALWVLPQVILTPHVSGVGPRYWERSMELFARNLRAYLDGRPLENVVDKRAGY